MTHSQAKGKRAELAVVSALVRAGLPARRHVRTGTRDVHDEGDIRLETAPVTIEVKDWARGYSRGQVIALLEKLEQQKREGDLGLLVCKRAGVTDAAGWDCWVTPRDAARLILGHEECTGYRLAPDAVVQGMSSAVQLIFGDVLAALTAGGWVTELANPFRGQA